MHSGKTNQQREDERIAKESRMDVADLMHRVAELEGRVTFLEDSLIRLATLTDQLVQRILHGRTGEETL